MKRPIFLYTKKQKEMYGKLSKEEKWQRFHDADNRLIFYIQAAIMYALGFCFAGGGLYFLVKSLFSL